MGVGRSGPGELARAGLDLAGLLASERPPGCVGVLAAADGHGVCRTVWRFEARFVGAWVFLSNNE